MQLHTVRPEGHDKLQKMKHKLVFLILICQGQLLPTDLSESISPIKEPEREPIREPIEATWNAWKEWETCTERCGKGKQVRLRTCKNTITDELYNERACELQLSPGITVDEQACEQKDCGMFVSSVSICLNPYF